MNSLLWYFKQAIAEKASDLHLIAGEKAYLRVGGELKEIEDKILPETELKKMALELLNKEQSDRFATEMDLDFSTDMDGVRFRINLHHEEGKIGLSARMIPGEIPSADDLHLEPAVRDFATLLDGLVLVVGPTGHGKSTTLACLIEEINKTRKAHIITIEDPIEFIFKNNQSLIEQREVGTDTPSFASALKHVLRQDPNVILVGEMRDPETIATVLTAAETGHLVFSTLHTSSASEAIERIVDVFDGAKQKQILIQLGQVLRGVVAQQLVPGSKGGLVAAREVLINTPAVANLIKENNVAQIRSVIQTSLKDGMFTLEHSLEQLAKDDLIDSDTVKKRSGRGKHV